jgi:RNA polymerase sigma-70 factor, ECF subfamily
MAEAMAILSCEAARENRVEIDAELVRKARTCAKAFTDLYEFYYPGIFNYAMRTTMNVSVAEDVTSETFLKAFEGLTGFDPEKGSFAGWLYRIATNVMRDHFRKRSREALREGDELTYDLLRVKRMLGPRTMSQPAEQLEQHQRLHKAILRLKSAYRLAIVLYYFERKSQKEIAAIMGCTVLTVRWRLHHARHLLAGRLAGNLGG